MSGQQKQTDETEALRQIGEMWESAKAELAQLRQAAEHAVEMGKAQAGLTVARSERERALLKLGEAYYGLVKSGELEAAPALKRAIGEVKVKEIEVMRQQADIAAILKEADALAERKPKKARSNRK